MLPALRIMPNELLSGYVKRAMIVAGLSNDVDDDTYFSILSQVEDTKSHIISLSSSKRLFEDHRTKKLFQSFFQSDLKLCSKCSELDMKSHGFTFYRTYHQSSFSYLCPLHKTELKNQNNTESLLLLKKNGMLDQRTEKLLTKLATIIMLCYTHEITDFSKLHLRSYIKDFLTRKNIFTKLHVREYLISKYDINTLDFLSDSLHRFRNKRRLHVWANVYNSKISHEELIVLYCLLVESASPSQFIDILGHSTQLQTL